MPLCQLLKVCRVLVKRAVASLSKYNQVSTIVKKEITKLTSSREGQKQYRFLSDKENPKVNAE